MGKDDERNTESDGYRYTQLVAPLFAGFSLPAIIAFASDKYPGPPWHDIILSLLVTATSLFITSTRLMTTPITENGPKEPELGVDRFPGSEFALSRERFSRWACQQLINGGLRWF